MKNRKGFTLVELVIVIAVIAILSAVLVPTFSSVIESAKVSSASQRAANGLKEYLSKIVVASTEDEIDTVKDLEGYIFVVENGTGVSDYVFAIVDGKLTDAIKVNYTTPKVCSDKAGDTEITLKTIMDNGKADSYSFNGLYGHLEAGAATSKVSDLTLEVNYKVDGVDIYYGGSALGYAQAER